MRFVSCTLLLLLAASTAFACMQEGPGFTKTRGPSAGTSKDVESMEVNWLRKNKAASPPDRLPDYAAWYKDQIKDAPPREQSRLIEEHAAVRDILNGNYDRAIKQLLAVEAAHPERADIAGTLGTAYERVGDYDSALRWIKTGIERNPKAHAGTEWLHARILETAIALKADPSHLENNPILPLTDAGLPLGGAAYAAGPRDLTRESVMDALYYQLGERMLFIKPEDPITESLLRTFARLEESANAPAATAAFNALALEYSRDGDHAKHRNLPLPADNFDTRPLVYGALIGIVALGLFLKYRAD